MESGQSWAQPVQLERMEGERHKCLLCDKTYSHRSPLRRHISNAHGENATPSTCHICNLTCKNKHSGEDSSKRFRCTDCGKCYKNYPHLIRHKTDNHSATSARPLICPYCSAVLRHKSSLQNVSVMDQWMDLDQSSSVYVPVLIADPSSRAPRRKFPCDQCSKTYTDPAHRSRHKRNIHGRYQELGGLPFAPSSSYYKCSLCEKSYCDPSVLKRHFVNIHGKDAEPHQCPLCQSFFKNKNSLRTHQHKFHK
ncbi:hypothetical protein B566_EDAN018142 [Ephemera danica]|nr:hypothetical protein B566_EDAN018142 [Ephemera danica]